MTDHFLTKGLESDRYLKTLRLPNQFEDEIIAVLSEFGQRMRDEHPDLFNRTAEPKERSNRSTSTALATHRINYSIKGVRASGSDQNPNLNVHLYWMRPTEYGRTDIDGALRAFGYKIKDADTNVDDSVVERTRAEDWPLDTAYTPFDENIKFYRHVSSKAEIDDTMDKLVDHFSTFRDEYAVGSDE